MASIFAVLGVLYLLVARQTVGDTLGEERLTSDTIRLVGPGCLVWVRCEEFSCSIPTVALYAWSSTGRFARST